MAPESSSTASGPRPVGEAVIVRGEVRAVAVDGTQRLLMPGSPVFADERIVTGSDGMVSILFADGGHTRLDLGRMSDVPVGRDLPGDVLPVDSGEAAAEVSALHQALQADDFDPTVQADAPAAGGGEAGAGGGGHPYVVFEVNAPEVIPDSGPAVTPASTTETTGVEPAFPGPPTVDTLPLVPESREAAPSPAEQVAAGGDSGGDSAGESGGSALPLAVADAAGLVEVGPVGGRAAGETGHMVSGNLLANDTSVDGALAVTGIEVDGVRYLIPGGGSLSLTTGLGAGLTVHSDGSWVYTMHSSIPHEAAGQGDGRPDFEVFTYTVTDGSGESASSTLTVDILDTVPQAHPDTNLTVEGAGAPITGNVIFGWDDGAYVAGSSDTESGDPGLSLVDVRGDLADSFTLDTALATVHGGTVIFHGDGSYVYTPPAVLDNSGGADSPGRPVQEHFIYTVEDGDGSPASAGLTIDILDTAPVAENDRASVAEGDTDGDGINNQVSGNLILADHNTTWDTDTGVQDQADRGSADGDMHLVSMTGDFAPGVDFVPGRELATAQGGSLVVHDNGSYTYTAPDHIIHEGPGGGDGIPDNEQFVYTVEDADGSQASAVLTVAIQEAGSSGGAGSGADDGNPIALSTGIPASGIDDSAADAAGGQDRENSGTDTPAGETAASGSTADDRVAAGEGGDTGGSPAAAEPGKTPGGDLVADAGADAFADGADPGDTSVDHLVPPPDPTA